MKYQVSVEGGDLLIVSAGDGRIERLLVAQADIEQFLARISGAIPFKVRSEIVPVLPAAREEPS